MTVRDPNHAHTVRLFTENGLGHVAVLFGEGTEEQFLQVVGGEITESVARFLCGHFRPLTTVDEISAHEAKNPGSLSIIEKIDDGLSCEFAVADVGPEVAAKMLFPIDPDFFNPQYYPVQFTADVVRFGPDDMIERYCRRLGSYLLQPPSLAC